MLELRGIHKGFHRGTVNETILFSDFSLCVEKGEFVSLVGANGSGKTTLLNLISGTLPCDGGRILLDGKDMTDLPEYKRSARIGRVFQAPGRGTVPDMTILENLSLAENKGRTYGLGGAVNKKKTEEFREQVALLGLGLEDKMHMEVGLLSGGQRQALALLMSTMTPIDLLLLDEHTAALDPQTSARIMELTERIVRQRGVTTLMVTHNLRYAADYGTRLVMLKQGSVVLDCRGEDKKQLQVDEILSKFHQLDTGNMM